MIIISYSKTTAALIAGEKTVTRRDWSDEYAERFRRAIAKTDNQAQAWSASPHRKGRKIAIIRVLSLTKEPTRSIPDSDWEAEGFAYMTANGLNVEKDMSCEKMWRLWRQDPTKEVWVVRHELVELMPQPEADDLMAVTA